MKQIFIKIIGIGLVVGLFFFASAKFLSVGGEEIGEADVIIVLGYPCTPDGQISPTQRSRIDKGIELFDRSNAQNLVFTGGAAHNKYVESEVMKAYAISKGVKAYKILIEGKSQSTYENAKYSAEMLRDKSLKYVIVSSLYHTRRARLIFKKHFPELEVSGAEYPKEIGLFKRAGAILHEYLGFCYYYIVQKNT